jgi:uncharacterized membrane protein YeiH
VEVAELAGTVTFAVSGVFAVAYARLDWFGVIVVGIVTAVGGGSIRDVILDNTPVFWVEELGFLAAATLGAVAAIPLARQLATGPVRRFEQVLQFADAAGLALFAVVGAQTALDLGFDATVAVVAAMVTGVGGGVIRDLLADRTPLILTGEIYATAALAGALVYVTLVELTSLDQWVAALLGALVVFGLRALGIHKQWLLPSLEPSGERGGPANTDQRP